jgi:pyrophosphate--fructose-6-phosphate 1-phosphotransferase
VRRRAEAGRNYGVCIVPEGLIEFIPEMRALIDELNHVLHEVSAASGDGGASLERQQRVRQRISRQGARTFDALPARIREQLLLERDSHGNVQVSKIDTEALLVEQVERRLGQWAAEGAFSGKFQVQTHFFGYEGRSAAPSNFDAGYTYTLGHVAAALIAFERTGYICAVRDLAAPVDRWRAGGVPLTAMMQIETRKGRPTPVIGKALVATGGAPFRAFRARRDAWQLEDHYVYPGAIQYFGPPEVCGQPTLTLRLEQGVAPEALVGAESA